MIGRILMVVQAIVVVGLVAAVAVTEPYGSRPWVYLAMQPLGVAASGVGIWAWWHRRWPAALVCQAVVLVAPWGYLYITQLFPLALLALAGWEARKDRIAAKRRPRRVAVEPA